MSSWHAPNCDRPRVEFGRDQVPRCRSCHRHFVPTPDLLLTDHTATAGEENAPVFEVPERQGPLQWPKSVKYQTSLGLQLPPKPPSQPHRKAASRTIGYSDLISVEAESQSAAPESSNRLSQRRPVTPAAPATHPQLTSGKLIRVLKLSPGCYDDPIHGVMELADLDKSPRYDALSYTWADEHGSRALSHGIFLGPEWRYFPVTINCAAALRRLRHRQVKSRRIWIDSICIDQSNVQERSYQVGLMSIIYSRAGSVIMYVGEHSCGRDVHGNRFMTLVREAREGYSIATEVSGSDRWAAPHFFQRPYFSRIWIIQEVALSRSAHVCCGPDVLPWSKFRPQRLKLAGVEKSHIPSWTDLTSVPKAERSWDVKDFPKILFATSQCRSADPRDRIFGLLGLFEGSEDANETQLQADYSISTEETFIGTAAFLLNELGLDYMLKLSNIRPREYVASLPSWVPTWTQKPSDLSCMDPSEKLLSEEQLKHYFWSREAGSLVATLAPRQYTSKSFPDIDLDFYGVDNESGGLVITGVEVLNSSMFQSCSAISSSSGVNFHYYDLPKPGYKVGVLPRYDQNKQGKYDWFPYLPEDRLLPRDCVVAVRGCDELLHLRPKLGDYFEIVGTCAMAMIVPAGSEMGSEALTDDIVRVILSKTKVPRRYVLI